MKLTVSCPSCGKTFRNIKPEMAGKKARCACGTVIRLGARELQQSVTKRKSPNPKPVDLLDVDLLGDEMLGDQLLGGDLRHLDSAPPVTTRSTPIQPRQIHQNSTGAKPVPLNPKSAKKRSAKSKPAKTKSAKSKSPKIKRGPTANVVPEVALDPPTHESKPRPKRTSQKVLPKPKSHRAPLPEVPLTISVTKSKSNTNSQRPLFDQTYSDLDEILAGAGDAAPLMVRPASEISNQSRSSSPSGTSPTTNDTANRKPSSLGFIAALGSATLAFWFGLFIATSRFQVVDLFLLNPFSVHLRSVFSVAVGETEVPQSFQLMFASLGWLLWIVAVALVMIAICQLINAFVKMLSERQPASWADGLAGAFAVSAVFLLVAIVFCQSSFAKQERDAMDLYEQPFVNEGEHLENVSLLRAVIDKRDRSFTTTMLVGATVPMSIFVLSMVRLFAKSTEEP